MVVLAATSIGGAAQAAAAADVLVALLSLASYAFYIFCGVALCYSVIMFKKSGDTNELIRGLLGAALFFTAPTFLAAVIHSIG